MEKFRVLLVDDEVEFVETMAKRFVDRGLEVATAHSGFEAVKLLDKSEFDVAILNVKMPGMDGIETLRIMKKKRPHTEVIMLTGGHGSGEMAAQALELGAYNYLLKPFPFKDLLDEMEQAYERKLIQEEIQRQT